MDKFLLNLSYLLNLVVFDVRKQKIYNTSARALHILITHTQTHTHSHTHTRTQNFLFHPEMHKRARKAKHA